MEALNTFISFFLHLDQHLARITETYGAQTYAILFAIVFAETGLVVMPLLPGDSLLFAAGSIAALGTLNPYYLFALLTVAAILGDFVNYHIGAVFGKALFRNPDSRIFKQVYLERTSAFYAKHGHKTIVIARFIPIVRTFAPFVAGMGRMGYARFATYNVLGAVLWVGLFVFAGYFFGAIPVVKKNFTLVILAIIFLSVLPGIIEVLRQRRLAKTEGRAAGEAG